MTRAKPLPPDVRRAEIISAARPLLLRYGGAFTTRQVAEAADIAEGTIFRVFPTKADLVQALAQEVLDPTPVCARIAAIPASRPVADRIATIITILHEGIRDSAEFFRAVHAVPSDDTLAPGRPHKDMAAITERSRRLRSAIEACLAPDAGHLSCPAAQAASLIRSVATATAHPFFADDLVTEPGLVAELLSKGLVK